MFRYTFLPFQEALHLRAHGRDKITNVELYQNDELFNLSTKLISNIHFQPNEVLKFYILNVIVYILTVVSGSFNLFDLECLKL